MGGPAAGSGGGEALGTAAGIGLSGGYIYNALAAGNKDAVEEEAKTLDVCLSHPTPEQGGSSFHYHYWSPCLKKNQGYWSDSQSPPLCSETENCLTSTSEFVTSNSASG